MSVLDAHGLVLAVDSQVGIESWHVVDSALISDGKRRAVFVAVVEDGRVERLVEGDADNGARESTECLAHQGEVM